MKKSYQCELATHFGPESCGAALAGGVEALIGERAGRVFSRVRTPSRNDALSALERVRQAAREDKRLRFTAHLHHIYNLDTLRMAYLSLKKEAAPGVDGETWRHYGETVAENLQDLFHRLKRGADRAKPVRRVYIPKADGRQRPLGVTTLEDKIVQRATVEVLNAIYETQNGRVLWDRMQRLITRWLPLPKVCHPYPLRRMGVVNLRQEPDAGKPPVRIRGGSCEQSRFLLRLMFG